jgi:hypothetical protein
MRAGGMDIRPRTEELLCCDKNRKKVAGMDGSK